MMSSGKQIIDELTKEYREEKEKDRAEREARMDKMLDEAFEKGRVERQKERAEQQAITLKTIEKAFEEDRQRRRRVDAMFNRKSILQAVRDEIQGRVPQSDSIVEAYKQVNHLFQM